LSILLGLLEALELLITQLVERPRNLSVYLSNPSQPLLVLLVATDSRDEPIGHDSANVGELGAALLVPGQIPGGVQMPTGTFTPGVTAPSTHLVEAGCDHRNWVEHLPEQHAPLLIQATHFLSEFACIQESIPQLICIYHNSNQISNKKRRTTKKTLQLALLQPKTP